MTTTTYTLPTRSFHFRRLLLASRALAIHWGQPSEITWARAREAWEKSLYFVFFQ